MLEMFNSLNALSENESLFKVGLFSNIYLWIAIAISVTVHAFIIYIPLFSRIFGTVELSLEDWIQIIKLSLPILMVEESLKYISRLYSSFSKNKKEVKAI